MTLYEITENITEEPEEAVTIKEASKRLNRTVGSLYGAAAEGRLINGRYYLEPQTGHSAETKTGTCSWNTIWSGRSC